MRFVSFFFSFFFALLFQLPIIFSKRNKKSKSCVFRITKETKNRLINVFITLSLAIFQFQFTHLFYWKLLHWSKFCCCCFFVWNEKWKRTYIHVFKYIKYFMVTHVPSNWNCSQIICWFVSVETFNTRLWLFVSAFNFYAEKLWDRTMIVFLFLFSCLFVRGLKYVHQPT